MNELESIVRDELRRDAANAPSGRHVQAAVLDAVAGVPMTERIGRRWAAPLLVAAAVVALAVAATLLLPRAFDRHSQPAHPKPSPSLSLPAAPSLDLHCAKGQQQVTGAGTRYSDTAGSLRYAYEYYCAAPDGSRSGSEIDSFRMVGGRLDYDHLLLSRGVQQYVMSMTGTDGGLVLRVYDASPGLAGHPGGVISDVHTQVDPDGGTGVGEPVAQPCLATDLTVRTVSEHQPTSHFVLQLTNHGRNACAVWGNPRYTQVGGQRVSIRSVLRGPAGGLGDEPSASPLVLQPGQAASSSIGSDPSDGSCGVARFNVALPNGVQLGPLDYGSCSVVSYPLVRAQNGSERHPELKAPASATGSCLGMANLVLGGEQWEQVSRAGMTVIISTNTSSCTITGYPDVRVLDSNFDPMPIPYPAHTRRGPLGGLTGDQPQQITVAPGHPASALVEWSEDPAAGHCVGGGEIWLSIGAKEQGSGPLPNPACDLQVHPFVAGTTGSG